MQRWTPPKEFWYSDISEYQTNVAIELLDFQCSDFHQNHKNIWDKKGQFCVFCLFKRLFRPFYRALFVKFRVLALLLLLQACPTLGILGTLQFDDFPWVSAVAYVLLARPILFRRPWCCWLSCCCWYPILAVAELPTFTGAGSLFLLLSSLLLWTSPLLPPLLLTTLPLLVSLLLMVSLILLYCWCSLRCWLPCCFWRPCSCFSGPFLLLASLFLLTSAWCCWRFLVYGFSAVGGPVVAGIMS